MEGSKIGVVRVLRDEICHRWWRARVSGEPRLFGEIGRLSVDIHLGFEKGFNLMFKRFGLC